MVFLSFLPTKTKQGKEARLKRPLVRAAVGLAREGTVDPGASELHLLLLLGLPLLALVYDQLPFFFARGVVNFGGSSRGNTIRGNKTESL